MLLWSHYAQMCKCRFTFFQLNELNHKVLQCIQGHISSIRTVAASIHIFCKKYGQFLSDFSRPHQKPEFAVQKESLSYLTF